MYRNPISLSLLIMPLLMLLPGSIAGGASLGVKDRGKFFSDDAISQAEQVIDQINQKHHKDVRIETFPEIPADMQGQFQQQGKELFYEGWASQLAKQNAVDGILILITRDPGHLQVWDGNKTQQRLFTLSDVGQLKSQLASAFKQKQYDEGLLSAVRLIKERMDANAGASGAHGAVPPVSSSPQNNNPTYFPASPHSQFHFGGIACVIVGVILFIVLIRAVFGRAGGGSYGRPGGYYPPQGGGYPPQGGYPPAGGYPMGGYPQQGGYGGGGSGFGKGFLGGLLGGAIGGYAADKWMGHGQQPGGGFTPPPAGGGADFSSGADTSGTSSGADFGSSGGGGADFGGGADSSGGGADFSSGGDSGGGGGSDFGGGGGGGDSGGGSDF